MVRRSTVAVFLVVVLVLLSGCSAVLDGGNGNGNGTAADVTPTPAPASFDYADGYGQDGVTDGQAAVDSHESALIDHGSYAGTYTYRINQSAGMTNVEVENSVDFDAEQGYQRVDVDDPRYNAEVEVYRNSTTRHERSEFDNRTSLNRSEQAFEPTDLTAIDPVRPLLLNVSEYEASMGERNGDTVIVYEKPSAEGVDSFYGINESANITSFSATLAVDSDGIVRSSEYELEYTTRGEERVLTVQYSLSEFGETTLDRPEWVDEA